jgi:hypothetical protein
MGAFCNGVYNSGLNPGQMCPDGKTVAVGPGGSDKPASQTPSTTTGKYEVQSFVPMPGDQSTGYFYDTSGRTDYKYPQAVNTSDIRGVYIASTGGVMDRLSKADAKAEYDNLPKETQDALTKLARARGGRSGKAVWFSAVDSAYKNSSKTDSPDTPWAYINKMAEATGGGTSGGGSGRYTGPTESRTIMAESDIRATANALAIELIGRPVSDKELNRLTEQMRKAEQQQPTVTTSTTGATTTTHGLTAQGREDILREVIAENPEYEKFQVDTTVLDAMTEFINKKKQVSGG